MEKTVTEIIEDETKPNQLEVRISRQFVKMCGGQFAFVSKPDDLRHLEPCLGKDIVESILNKFYRSPSFNWISISSADPSMGEGITMVSPEKLILSVHKITKKTKEKLTEALSNILGQKISHTTRERIVFTN